MTVTALTPDRRRSGLLEKLLAAVRAEFRTEIYHPDPDHPVFISPQCAVTSCDRVTWQQDLCNGHVIRWRHRGRPPMENFLADPGRPVRGRGELAACSAYGCRFGVNGRELCMRQYDRWVRAGRPGPDAWEPPALVVPDPVPGECHLPFCTLWVDNRGKIFCRGHHDRWRNAGRPDVEEFVVACQLNGTAAIDLRGLPAQLMLEFQYGMQLRADAHRRTAPPRHLMHAIRLAKTSEVSSLLDLDEAQWRQRAKSQVREPVLFLIETRDAVEMLRDGAGWEVEYPRDVWRMDRLPGIAFPHAAAAPRARLRLDRIAQPWLRDLGKRWLRLRLMSGMSISTVHNSLEAVAYFSRFLAHAGIDRLADVDRLLLERHLAWVASQPGEWGLKKTRIHGLNLFFQAIRQNRWDDTLPGTAAYYPAASTSCLPAPGRARHDPDRVRSQPRPLDGPSRPADHTDPGPVRTTDLQRAHAGLRLPRS